MKQILVPRILYMMSFIYERKAIVKILENSRIAGGDYRSNALELMDNVLKRKHARRFGTLLEQLFDYERTTVDSSDIVHDVQEVVQFVFNQPAGELSYWLKANCIRASRKNKTIIDAYISDEPRHTQDKVLKEEWLLYEQTIN